MSRVLILNDGRVGHLNQSIALAKYLGADYDIAEVVPRFKWSKICSYLLDRMKIKRDFLFHPLELYPPYEIVIGTGSSTAYMVKVVAAKLYAKSIMMMLPKGYRYDFDLIFAQVHDNPPSRDNIITLSANFAYAEPRGIYQAKKKSIALVIGGDTKLFKISKEKLKAQLDYIAAHYPEHELAVTTSPRTPEDIEVMIEHYGFDYTVLFSKNPVNPIADFLEQCETVFLTGDSTSMISEAVSYGNANIVVLPLDVKKPNKFTRFVASLEAEGYLHVFDGTIKEANRKIDFSGYAKKVIV